MNVQLMSVVVMTTAQILMEVFSVPVIWRDLNLDQITEHALVIIINSDGLFDQ